MPPAKRSAVVLRHVAFEDLGLLSPALRDAGWDASYRDAPTDDLGDPSIAQADLLIVLGGPVGVYEADAYPFLAKEVAILARRLAKDRPTFGICLGCQLMAAALGARVFPGPVKEIGWGPVDLTDEGGRSCLRPLADDGAAVLHWHGDTFDLPGGATRLARNAHYDNQAFSFGKRGLALQFHVEADPAVLDRWYVGHALELSLARISVAGLRKETLAGADRVRAQARKIFSGWLAQISEE